MSGNVPAGVRAIPVAGLILMAMVAAPGSAYPAGFKLVYSFAGGSDGAQPAVSLKGRSGVLYGVTGDGGSTGCGGTGCGTVYMLAGGTETILYRFAGGTDGYYPDGDVVADKHGNFYGTTYYGGGDGCDGNGCGTVYRVAPDGTETVLHAFAGGRDGAMPLSSLVRIGSSFYGTTTQGGVKGCGPYDCGTVFRIDGNGTETVLHRFGGGRDGAYPGSGLIADSTGNLYGTTEVGGSKSVCQGSGCGTVFKLAPDGSETVLHVFKGGTDGSGPTSSLVLDPSGNLYGTTAVGGSTACQGYGCGTVFKIGTDGKEHVLYAFQGQGDGNWPWGNLVIDTAGNLYGTTDIGGEGSGVVFKLAADRTETVLHAFTGSDGAQPNSLIADGKGNLYGATIYGGAADQGIVFKLKE